MLTKESFDLILWMSLNRIMNNIENIEIILQVNHQELAQIALLEIETDSEQRTEREQHKAFLNRELTIQNVWIFIAPIIPNLSTYSTKKKTWESTNNIHFSYMCKNAL